MEILKKIKWYGTVCGDRIAYQTKEQSLSYRDLDLFSDRIAGYLLEQYPDTHFPIPVYGHKQAFMIIVFLACVKSGHAYCPVDICMPESRVGEIVSCTGSPLVLAVSEYPVKDLDGDKGTENRNGEGPDKKEIRIMDAEELACIARTFEAGASENDWVRPEDTYYIIFTSGSTGKPKGVQIPYGCLNHFLDWSVNLGNPGEEKEGCRFLNQAPFSFDLSVMDLYTCLALGGTLLPLDKETQGNYPLLFERLSEADPNVFVSTPSFAEMCLADPKLSGTLLPSLRLFLFCGERLTNTTARKLKTRFPEAKIINTYGPTESTVAMTSVEVTDELLDQYDPVPVGAVKEGSFVRILKEDGTAAPEGESGEILILGDTVSTGYFGQKDLTDAAFFEDPETGLRGYRTGDEGYLRDGMLFYNGRIDLQIKLHGYRIELMDIENNLERLPEVSKAVVVPNMKDGRAVSLTAFVSLSEEAGSSPCDAAPENRKAAERKMAGGLRKALMQYLPEYMIPRKIIFLTSLPMTMNGKADRKKLKEMLEEKHDEGNGSRGNGGNAADLQGKRP